MLHNAQPNLKRKEWVGSRRHDLSGLGGVLYREWGPAVPGGGRGGCLGGAVRGHGFSDPQGLRAGVFSGSSSPPPGWVWNYFTPPPYSVSHPRIGSMGFTELVGGLRSLDSPGVGWGQSGPGKKIACENCQCQKKKLNGFKKCTEMRF